MIELYLAHIPPIAPNASALTQTLCQARRDRLPTAPPYRQNDLRSLAAGLLLQYVFGRDTLERDLMIDPSFGKPYLKSDRSFNLSHAGDYAVLAVAQAPVGVDIERVRPLKWEQLCLRFFHPDEQLFLHAANDPLTAFFSLWTRKESLLKARGQGFSVSPSSFSVLDIDESLLTMGNERYAFYPVDAPPFYQLCVCAKAGESIGSIRHVAF